MYLLLSSILIIKKKQQPFLGVYEVAGNEYERSFIFLIGIAPGTYVIIAQSVRRPYRVRCIMISGAGRVANPPGTCPPNFESFSAPRICNLMSFAKAVKCKAILRCLVYLRVTIFFAELKNIFIQFSSFFFA